MSRLRVRALLLGVALVALASAIAVAQHGGGGIINIGPIVNQNPPTTQSLPLGIP